MQIDIDTKFITLIGVPLRQSFAARMQNAAYDAMGLNMRYFYSETDSEHLREIIDGVRYNPAFIGASTTKPNKVEVLQYLDELDPLCAKIGSCNTIVKTPEGKLVGHNTDCTGFYEAFVRGEGFPADGKTFFCFGAGGAGRAICSALAHNGAKKIYITDTIDESAQAVVADINESFTGSSAGNSAWNEVATYAEGFTDTKANEATSDGVIAVFVPYGDFSAVPECDCVINASGVGMGESIGTSPLPAEHIVPGKVYFDACYNPEKTQFLLDAQERGCKVMNGLDMSLYQGVAQIRLWTGQEPPVDVMREELRTILKEQSAN